MGEARAGEVIGGRYVLESPLGKGGFGAVWRAIDRGPPERAIALKILHAELARNPRMKERFAREAMVLGALDHPCIARSLDFGTQAMPPFIAMELVRGRTLQSEIEEHALRKTMFSERDVLLRMQLIASAIDHAHDKGVIHRDLKPGNVIVDAASSPLTLKVLDFGVAKIVGQSGDATTAGRIIGSLHYLSPEHIRGEELDPRADVFSLGTLLFELLTLRRVWTRDWEDRPLLAGRVSKEIEALNATPAVMQRIMSGMRVRAGAYREGLHAAVDEVIARAVASDRSARFSRAGELVSALEGAFSGVATGALFAVPQAKTLPASLSAAAAPTAGLPVVVATVATAASIEEVPREATVATIVGSPAHDTQLREHVLPSPAAASAIGLPSWLMRALVVLALVAPIFAIGVLVVVMDEERAREAKKETPPPLERVEPEAVQQPVARAMPLEKQSEPEARAEPQPRPRVTKTQPQPREEKPPPVVQTMPAYPELRALLKTLEEKPNDLAIAQELSKKIAAAADDLRDADRRTSIKRCAAGALFPLDAKELARCYRELASAQGS